MRSIALQSLTRSFWADRIAGSFGASTSRRFGAAAHADDGLPREVANEGNRINKGAKIVLFGILKAAQGSLTTAQIWEQAEAEGVRSKRFMKEMLLQMKKARHIKAIKGKGESHFGYIMPDKLPPPPALPPKVQLKPVKSRFVQPLAAQQHARQ